MPTMNARWFAAALLVALGCGSGGDGGDGGGRAQGHGGYCAASLTSASEATTEAQCHYDGCGGSDCPPCYPFTIELSEAVPADGLNATITTSTEVFTGCATSSEVAFISPTVVCERTNATVERVLLATSCGHNIVVDAFQVELVSNGTVIGTADYQQPAYGCVAQTGDDWCWQADPVQLSVVP
jgi:hypothetical protein